MINWNKLWSKMWWSHLAGNVKSPHWDNQEFPLGAHLTSRQAWARVRPHLEKFAHQACLRSIEAPAGVRPDGCADAWKFSVDVPTRHAQGYIQWSRHQDEGVDRIECCWYPFPAIGSPQHILAASGEMPERWLSACWDAMRDQAHDIPEDFMDSSDLLSLASQRGLALNGARTLSLNAIDMDPTAAIVQWELLADDQIFKIPVDHTQVLV